jgi:flagellar operon protein
VGPNRIDYRPVAGTQAPAQAGGLKGQFAEILRNEQQKPQQNQELKISAHASARLLEAGRALSGPQIRQVNEAVDKAARKGSRESLLLMDDLALVVSVPNRTVITAVTGDRMKDSMFTNIDSAIIVNGPDLKEGARGVSLYQSRPMAQ